MEESKDSFRWVVAILLLLNIFSIYLSINCIPPLFKELGEEIPITKSDMGMIVGVALIASLFFSLIGGGVSDKIGSRWSFGVAIIVVAIAGALRSIVGSSFGLVVCMFLVGVGLAIAGPNIPKALGMWFPSKELATANGISMLGLGLGGAVGMGTAAGILSPALGGWRNVMVAIGGFTLITGILWIVFFKDVKTNRPSESKDQSMADNFRKVFGVKDIWWAAVYYGLCMASVMSVIALLPHSLSERGLTEAKSGALVSIMLFVSTVFTLVGGILSDKAGRRKPFLIVCAMLQGVCFIVFIFSTGIPLIIALAIAGASMGTLIPVFTVIPVEIKEIGHGLAATAVGILFMVGNTGGFFGPIIAGKIMDVTRTEWPGFLFMIVAIIVAGFCILPVRETGQRGQQKK
jgi:cyanate permease